MKLAAGLLLIVAGFGVFQGTLAGISQVPVDLLEKLKIQDDEPSVTALGIELEDFEINELRENPPVIEELLPEKGASAKDCIVSIRSGLTDPQPVFLETDKNEFYPFSERGNLEVPAGENLQMFCPGKFKNFAKNLITATCVSGNEFEVDGLSYKFAYFVCKSWPGFVVRKTGHNCSGGTALLEVGFKVSPQRFIQQMQICFDEHEEVTRYVYHTLHPGSHFYQTSVERISFQTSGFFGGKNVDKLYSQKIQTQTLNDALDGEAHKYIDSSKNVFLARGHLGAKADLMFGSQQRGTFLFVNAAPQWQVFNAGNWVRIEDGVRTWVSKNKKHVDCYTGVWGVTTLPNKQGQETPLYLAHDDNNNGLIPVPKLYFRVIIEPATEKGIVFIGVNNPHLTLEQIKKDYILCKDVSKQVNYINWKRTNIMAGYSYACEVSDFLKKVKDLPELSANGGLLV